MKTPRPNPAKLQAQCDAFNQQNVVGAAVRVKKDSGEIIETTTRSRAEVLSGHLAVIWLDGISGCYQLDRVHPIKRTALPYQKRVGHWMHACFGNSVPYDAAERNFRFLEEALELAQSCGATAEDAGKLVAYVFNRPVGDPRQEVGGVEVTLAALCNAHGIDLDEAREAELDRVWSKADQIRAKHESKPKDIRSPLPGGAHG